MLFSQAQYEIEFRCHFSSDQEAYQVLPFLKASLIWEYTWYDHYHGLEVFRSGQVLRASGVSGPDVKRSFVGWKGQDSGTFTNLRREFNEETTGQINDSAIMAHFCRTHKSYLSEEIEPALERAGYTQFMAYEGHSLTGKESTLGLNTKLMHCASLKWPILVELEMIASNGAEARQNEKQLEQISQVFRLESHLVKEEPGTLLYQKTFGKEGRPETTPRKK